MTMEADQHPDDERLAALAGGEPEAAGDDLLRGHVAGCSRCAALVDDLAILRSALGELPDLTPSRPLELWLPAPRTGWLGQLAAFSQRAFAPVMGVASALLLAGVIGTGVEVADQMAAGPQPDAAPAPAMAPFEDVDDHDRSATEEAVPGAAGEREDGAGRTPAEDEPEAARLAVEGTRAVVDSWPWNALLAVGAALMIVALVMRLALRSRAEA